MSPVQNHPFVVEGLSGVLRVDVAEHPLRTAHPRHAVLIRTDLAAIVADEAQLGADRDEPVGVRALLTGVHARRRLGDARALGHAPRSGRQHADVVARLGKLGRDRRATAWVAGGQVEAAVALAPPWRGSPA